MLEELSLEKNKIKVYKGYTVVNTTGYKKINTAVFISGNGSNLQSLIKFSKTRKSPIYINLIVSNNPKAKGLKLGKINKIKKK